MAVCEKMGNIVEPTLLFSVNIVVVKVCAKLHNFCIQEWKQTGSHNEEIRQMQSDYRMYKDLGVFLGWDDNRMMDDRQELLDDAEVMATMGKHMPAGVSAARLAATRREELRDNIDNHGVRYYL
jgi:hypothetical protein